ncbi:MAG: hypothetical protein WCK28_00020 [Burkholderiales bacterium]|jgi:hypothetical protein
MRDGHITGRRIVAASWPTPWGSSEIELTDEAVAAAGGLAAAVAAHLGVTVAQMNAWIESDFTVRCAGRRADGKPCRGFVTGGSNLADPKAWVAMQGEYCPAHGGPGR